MEQTTDYSKISTRNIISEKRPRKRIYYAGIDKDADDKVEKAIKLTEKHNIKKNIKVQDTYDLGLVQRVEQALETDTLVFNRKYPNINPSQQVELSATLSVRGLYSILHFIVKFNKGIVIRGSVIIHTATSNDVCKCLIDKSAQLVFTYDAGLLNAYMRKKPAAADTAEAIAVKSDSADKLRTGAYAIGSIRRVESVREDDKLVITQKMIMPFLNVSINAHLYVFGKEYLFRGVIQVSKNLSFETGKLALELHESEIRALINKTSVLVFECANDVIKIYFRKCEKLNEVQMPTETEENMWNDAYGLGDIDNKMKNVTLSPTDPNT